jgi:hypothetical protein
MCCEPPDRNSNITGPTQNGDTNRLTVRTLWALLDVISSKPNQAAFRGIEKIRSLVRPSSDVPVKTILKLP